MTTNQRNKISFITACVGALSAFFVESAHTPNRWSVEWWSLVCAIFAITGMRLYLFSEGSAMNEIKKVYGKIAFILSFILTVLLIGYGVYLKFINDRFGWHALGLFIILQLTLSAVEWVFAVRTGEQVNTVLATIQNRNQKLLEIAKGFRSMTKEQAKVNQSNTERINDLSKENTRQAERILKLETANQSDTKTLEMLTKAEPKVDRVNGAPVCYCPQCLKRGELNLLVGGSRSKVLTCEVDGWEIDVPITKQKVKS